METLVVEEPREAEAQSACPECGEPIPERFCTRCGEKRVEERDYTLRHFLAEALNVVANLESPIPRSLFVLLFRPGLLTAEYLAGRRKRYLKPLQLFVLCNVIFFFAQPLTGFNTLTTPLRVHLTALPHSRAIRQMVFETVERRGITLEQYGTLFDATIHNQAKTLVILMVPMLALVLLALYRRQSRYFVKHLVFATHFYSLFLLLLFGQHFFIYPLIRAAMRLGFAGSLNHDIPFTIGFLTLCGIYLYNAQRRVYSQRRAVTLLKCLALVFSIAVIVQTYRLVLFFTAFYTV